MQHNGVTHKNVYSVGVGSWFGGKLCSNIPLSMGVFFCAIQIVVLVIEQDLYAVMRASLLLAPIFILCTLAFYIIANKWCYKAILDYDNNLICLFMFFGQGKIQQRINNIKIIIGIYCSIIIDGNKYGIHVSAIHDLVSYLPKETKVEYAGRIGKYKEQDWERRGIPLIPGSKLYFRNINNGS